MVVVVLVVAVLLVMAVVLVWLVFLAWHFSGDDCSVDGHHIKMVIGLLMVIFCSADW